MNYFVLDVETANPNYASICQIGLIEVRDGQILDSRSILLDPEDFFDPFNVSIHGITDDMVTGSPTFRDVYSDLSSRLVDQITIHHGPFDRVAFSRASARYGLQPIMANWLDNQSVVRRTWPDFARSGYGLKNLCRHFDLTFSHHDALEDARVTEQIFRRSLAESGTTASDWLARSRRPIASQTGSAERTGDPNGRFHGQTILFTGDIGLSRTEAEEIARKVGFNTAASMTKKVNLLVVGIQDINRLAGHNKSSKQRKAEELQRAGHDVQIISDSDFWAMMPPTLRPAPAVPKIPSTPRKNPRSEDLVIEVSLESLFTDDELEEMFGSLLNDEST